MSIKNLLVTPNEMKAVEAISDENGVSYWQMMVNAGTNAAEKIIEIADKDSCRILFLAGNGNNGGDCFVSAKYLHRKGYKLSVLLVNGLPKTEIAKKAFEELKSEKVDCFVCEKEEDFTEKMKDMRKISTIIVDGIFGTGFHGKLPHFIEEEFYNISKWGNFLKIAYDIPSGGDGKDGKASQYTFKADYTFTFGFMKTGLFQYPLHEYCGEIIPIDLEIDTFQCAYQLVDTKAYKEDQHFDLITKNDLFLTKRKPDSNKGTFGSLLCITGSERMPGAASMSTLAALKSGVGTVTVATAKNIIPILASNIYEAMYLPLDTDEDGFISFTEKNKKLLSEKLENKKITSVLIGCGIGVTENTKKLVKWVIENAKVPVIIDADGINCIADSIDILKSSTNRFVLTPHPGEMARIAGTTTDDIQKNRFKYARLYAERYKNSVIVLKGAGTIVAYSDSGSTYQSINIKGNSGMSKGGSGDVLAGLLAGMSALSNRDFPESLFYMAKTAVYLHALAGDIAKEKYTMYSMLPTDIINCIPEAVKESVKDNI